MPVVSSDPGSGTTEATMQPLKDSVEVKLLPVLELRPDPTKVAPLFELPPPAPAPVETDTQAILRTIQGLHDIAMASHDRTMAMHERMVRVLADVISVASERK